MKLGCFSISLAVKNINKSYEFYQTLGFEKYHGDIEQGWLILKNGETNIGLFQGMFENNILTFNPGWDQNGKETASFDDVRDIQKHLVESGVKIDTPADENSQGPAHMVLTDPDGNQIMLDQHR
jgi:predicted lactoylglutathione lyase